MKPFTYKFQILSLCILLLWPLACQKDALPTFTELQTTDQFTTEERGTSACISQSALDAGCMDPEQGSDMDNAGCTNWRQFEINVCCTKYSSSAAKAAQVKLEVDVPGVGKKNIIADIMVKVDNKWRIVECKTSATADLRTISLANRCTANQKLVYPHLNSGSRSAKVIGFYGSQTAGLTLNGNVNLCQGVDFYVNYPAGQYGVTSIFPRVY
jgi:hypothetical protein